MDPPPRVVVADDDALARRVITGTLRDAGIDVVAEAINGLEAVEAVELHQPDLVVLDILMPELDGIEAARRIAERARRRSSSCSPEDATRRPRCAACGRARSAV